MKTQEELNALKEEVETVNEKVSALTEEELAQVTAGNSDDCPFKPTGTGAWRTCLNPSCSLYRVRILTVETTCSACRQAWNS